MRAEFASCRHWLTLLLIDLISYGLTADYKKQDLVRALSGPKISLMDTMMRKYSYPKNEVTAGIGYGHYLHPFYYRGEREMMYPCAVECGEWKTTMTDTDDSSNDGSSNIDVVTVRPDVSSIEITTPKARPYKDASLLRSNKYKSTTSFPPQSIKSPKTYDTNNNDDNNNYEDSKGADVQIFPAHEAINNINGYSADAGNKGSSISVEVENNDELNNNDGTSLYGKYHEALLNGYNKGSGGDDEDRITENVMTENKNNNEYFDPVGESIRYNPPSFNENDNYDNDDDVAGAIGDAYSNRDNKFYPKRQRIEEKYVKHNLREERLEDVRTNNFGTSGDNNDDYSTESDRGSGNNQSDNNEPHNDHEYVDDYAAPKPSVLEDGNRFKPSPYRNGDRYPAIINSGYHRERDVNRGVRYNSPQNEEYLGGGSDSDYDYGERDRENEPSITAANGAYFNPTSQSNFQKINKPASNCAKKAPFGSYHRRPVRFRGRYNRHEYPDGSSLEAVGYSSPRNPKSAYHGNSYYGKKKTFSEGLHSYRPYAPGHGYSSAGSQEPLPPTRFNPGGIRLVEPPQRPPKPYSAQHDEKYPRYKNKGLALPAQSPRPAPRVRGQRINYREVIPQRDGFTKIAKSYKSFIGHTPKRYVASGEPYVVRV